MCCLVACNRAEEGLIGRVVKVADGDTLTLLDAANNQHKIRLNAIDAPEKDQAFGQKSKQRLSDYVFGKEVAVRWKSKDKYGRILGTVFGVLQYFAPVGSKVRRPCHQNSKWRNLLDEAGVKFDNAGFVVDWEHAKNPL